MVSVTSESHNVTSASPYQRRSSMYIRGLFPQNWPKQFRLAGTMDLFISSGVFYPPFLLFLITLELKGTTLLNFTIIRFLINLQVQGHHPHLWAPFQVAAHIGDLKPDLLVLLSRGLTVVSFHSWQLLPVNFSHVILGLPGPCLPSTCISHAILTAPLECSTCSNQRSLLSLEMRSRYWVWSIILFY